MKKRQVLILSLGLCFWLLVGLATAETWIRNLSVEKQGEFVAIKIYGSQPFQFSHASEVAKNGKPFRVFVDCQDAKLGLPQNNYFDLPGQTVVGLRTSQYQESPNKVVRVVLDCTRPVTYKVASQANWVEIDIASANESAFASWQAVSSDQPAVTQTHPPAKSHPPATAQPGIPELTKSVPSTSPEVSVQAQKQVTQSDKSDKKEDKPVDLSSSATKPGQQPRPSLAKPTAPQVSLAPGKTAPATDNQKLAPAVKQATLGTRPDLSQEAGQAESGQPRQTQSSGPLPAQKPAMLTSEQKPLVLAHKPEAEQWSGYPQREKVKYASQGRRDPFSPLFDRIEDYEFGVPPLASVENLTLVGILESFDQNLALLEDSRGFGYILQAGDKVKDGRVMRVAEDHVVFQVTEYGWTRNVTLELYKQTK